LKKIALLVAGGSGRRMNSDVPKQFISINGYPLLMYTLDVFYRYDQKIHIILVLPETQIQFWDTLCRKYKFEIRHQVKLGGKTRFHSVQNNLHDIPDDCLVAVHDGVRPLVSISTIDKCFKMAKKYGNAVPCTEIPESLRKINKNGNIQIDRNEYRLIQTPQVFKGKLLKEAYMQNYRPQFTDDASVVETLGQTIHLVKGNPENIKITYPKDLILASSLISSYK
jgi:2-C-methyl-D-erythritol 4-phosphate cytidylyltransferase